MGPKILVPVPCNNFYTGEIFMRYVFGILFKNMLVLQFAVTVGVVLQTEWPKGPLSFKVHSKKGIVRNLKKNKNRLIHEAGRHTTGTWHDEPPIPSTNGFEPVKKPESKADSNWGFTLFPTVHNSDGTKRHNPSPQAGSSFSTEVTVRAESSLEKQEPSSGFFGYFIKTIANSVQKSLVPSVSEADTTESVEKGDGAAPTPTSSSKTSEENSGDPVQTSSSGTSESEAPKVIQSLSNSGPSLVTDQQAGTLDSSFDRDGILISNLGFCKQGARAVHILFDGKRLILCQWRVNGKYQVALLRFHSDGLLDNNFGTQGTVVTKVISKANAYPSSLVVDSTGNILVAGYTDGSKDDDPFILRYLPNGSLDPSFGKGGIQIISLANSQRIYAAAIQKDNKIVLVGTDDDDILVIRHNTDGSLDRTFGGDGRVSWNVGGKDTGFGITIQPDGKILIAGAGNDEQDIVVGRILSDGKPDPAFDGDGFLVVDLQSKADCAKKVLLQSDMKIIVAGYTEVSKNDEDIFLLRTFSNGSLDPSFGSAGKTTLSASSSEDKISDAIFDNLGRIILAGHTGHQKNADSMIARFSSNGQPDASFGQNGVAIFSADSTTDELHAIALESDGKIFAVGGYGRNDYLLMRINH